MIIDVKKSKMFSIDPDVRFSKALGVDRGLWNELYRRHVLMGYTKSEMKEYLQIKSGKTIGKMLIKRWIIRTKVYGILQPIRSKGGCYVNSNIFGTYEDFVIKEVCKHLKNGDTKKSNIII